MILVGVTGSSVYTDDIFVSVEPGQAVEFGSYALSYPGLTPRYGVDRYTVGTTLSLSRDGRDVGKLTSEKTFWENRSQPSTEVGIFSTFKEDLYLNLAGWEGQTAQLHLQRFALVSWIGAAPDSLSRRSHVPGRPSTCSKTRQAGEGVGEKNVLVRHLKADRHKQILKDVSFQAGLEAAG